MALTAVTTFGAQSRASSANLSLKDLRLLCRGKLLSRVDNHIIWLEPFLKYNMGPFSWLYERMRPISWQDLRLRRSGPCQPAGVASLHSKILSDLKDCLRLPVKIVWFCQILPGMLQAQLVG